MCQRKLRGLQVSNLATYTLRSKLRNLTVIKLLKWIRVEITLKKAWEKFYRKYFLQVFRGKGIIKKLHSLLLLNIYWEFSTFFKRFLFNNFHFVRNDDRINKKNAKMVLFLYISPSIKLIGLLDLDSLLMLNIYWDFSFFLLQILYLKLFILKYMFNDMQKNLKYFHHYTFS